MTAELLGASRAHRRRAQKPTIRSWARANRVTYGEARRAAHRITLTRQQRIIRSAARNIRFRVLIAGRRFGKTHLACVELIAAAIERPGSLCWYVGPTYRMAKDIAWDTLKSLVPVEYLADKPNESTLTIRLTNGSRISLKGAEKPDRLRGRTLWFVVLDEFAQFKEAAWTEAIRPSLSTTRGGALFISTPMGFNWAYDLYNAAIAKRGKGWEAWIFTTAEGGLVSQEELDDAKAIQSPRVYRQEYLASFEALAGRVYDNFSRKTHVAATTAEEKMVDDDGTSTIYVGMDFNVNPMTAVLAQKRVDIGGKTTCDIFDVIELMSSNTEEMAAELRTRYPRTIPDPHIRGKVKPGRRIVICPDPHGDQRASNAARGETDITILERHGFVVDVPEHALLVKDRINNTQANLRDAGGEVHIRVHSRCAKLIKGWEGLTYKVGTNGVSTNQPDKDSKLDHVCDAADYMLWVKFNRLNAYRIGYTKRRV